MDKTSDEELIRLKIENLAKSMEQLGVSASGILLRATQLKGIQKHNEMVEAEIKNRSKELELKEKELQTLSSDLEQKVEAFEKERSEAGDLKKLVEECGEELRLKRNELTGKLDTSSRIQREIEVKKNQWRQHSAEIGRLCSETVKKKKELVLTLEQVKMKSLELASREKGLGRVRESIEVSSSEFEVKKKMVQSLNNDIEESREIKRLIEEQTSELLVMQNQHDLFLEKRREEILETVCRSSSEMEERAKEVKDKEKDLYLLKSQMGSEEKKLIQLKREMEVVTEIKKKDLELTLSRIEESVQQLAAVNEKLESQRRQLEMQSVEQVSKQMELETLRESSKRFVCDLEAKEKRLEELNNLIKISGEQFDLKSKELGEIERELKFKKRLRQMSNVLVKREKQPVSDISQRNAEEETEPIETLMLDGISASLTRHEVSSVLRATPNPAEFVLELVQDEIRKGLERAKDEIREGSRFQDTFLETLVLLFEELAKIQLPDKSQLQLQATEVATLWKERITIEAPKSTLEALAFLLFIIAYGLKTLINEEETALLASLCCSVRTGSNTLWRSESQPYDPRVC
ncbi:uncharacterized protein LOC108805241 [Raphanus sativus]|uniref:FRIGIDA-like protein n=1 Tax=Raphanus sativus TaxID=3726 RepID=A0A6J0JCY9_RAPSA|nr:uncharacterized protein LOC108805241 [Raphanus sativus]XP_018432738.1 uncharacterized protein LOC108805241 [Raphanus sativus]